MVHKLSHRRSARRSRRRSAKRSARRSVRRSARRSVRRSARRSVRRSAKRSARRSMKRSARRSARRSMKRSARRSMKRSARRSARRSVRRSARRRLSPYQSFVKRNMGKGKTLSQVAADWRASHVRGPEFINYVSTVLTLGQLKPEYVALLTDEQSMVVYNNAFTSPLFDAEHNYEAYEFLGDATLNKIIVWYLTRRFPQLMNAENVKTLARLKINLISKVSFARFGRELGVEQYITCTEEEWVKSQTKLVEDTLEAFIGALETQIDSKIKVGAGYAICYNIVSPILDRMDISLEYEDLYDAVTRLKEVFDTYHRIIGKVEYTTKQDPETKAFTSEVFSKVESHERGRNVPDSVASEIISLLTSRGLVPSSGVDVSRVKNFLSDITSKTDFSYSSISQGRGRSSKAAEIDAAEKAIVYLAKRGFIRVREQGDFVSKIPKNASVKTEVKDTPRGQYFQSKVSYNNKTGVGVGFTADESLARAAYSFAKL